MVIFDLEEITKGAERTQIHHYSGTMLIMLLIQPIKRFAEFEEGLPMIEV